ncbi:MAG: AAA family ATPase [Gemmatimonadota bacterium]
MMLSELIEQLSRPEAYDHPVDRVTVVQTHISVVFLAGSLVYKVKKPVDLGFLDFSTLERREHFCHEEVRLNRRLAPDVYLGVSPIVPIDGVLHVFEDSPPDGAPDPVEWAVRMVRLDDELRMSNWVADGTLRPYHVAVVARRLARFHANAARGPEIARWGRFDVVAGNARENLEQTLPHIGHTLTAELHERLTDALDRALDGFAPLIDRRAAAGIPRDTHGDLHLDHIYLFDDRASPGDVVVVDCIEFNERFRFADPVADIAFLDMDLRFQGRDDLANTFADAYFETTGDEEGRSLLRFYSAYRAAVRAKVLGIRSLEPEVPDADRGLASEEARAHWMLALQLLEPPRRRPCLVLVGGLPGTGKSTLSELLGESAGLRVISSDRTRKRLAGLAPETSAAAAYGEGLYTAEWNERTYGALLEEAELGLLGGERLIVDASFREDARRAAFLDMAERLRVPAVFLLLEAPETRVRERIATRPQGPSDADQATYEAIADRWESPSADTEQFTRSVHTGQTTAWSLEQALACLESLGTCSSTRRENHPGQSERGPRASETMTPDNDV